MRVSLPLLLFLLLFTACASSPPAPEPEILPCYIPMTWKEYDQLNFRIARKKGVPFTVKGKRYACLEKVEAEEAVCFQAKSKKEFERLSRLQEQHPERPLKVKGKNYRCLQLGVRPLW